MYIIGICGGKQGIRNRCGPGWACGRRSHQLADRLENELELAVVFLLQLGQLAGQVLVIAQHFPELHKRPHDGDVDVDRTGIHRRLPHWRQCCGAVGLVASGRPVPTGQRPIPNTAPLLEPLLGDNALRLLGPFQRPLRDAETMSLAQNRVPADRPATKHFLQESDRVADCFAALAIAELRRVRLVRLAAPRFAHRPRVQGGGPVKPLHELTNSLGTATPGSWAKRKGGSKCPGTVGCARARRP